MTQCERIMRHLESGKPLTSAEAMSEYGIHRLASRICDLKKLGYPIAKRQGKSKKPLWRGCHLCRVLFRR